MNHFYATYYLILEYKKGAEAPFIIDLNFMIKH